MTESKLVRRNVKEIDKVDMHLHLVKSLSNSSTPLGSPAGFASASKMVLRAWTFIRRFDEMVQRHYRSFVAST